MPPSRAAQLADALRERARRLEPGARMPSEANLMDEFGVARMTVRDAVGRLVGEGRLRVVHGRGTFVADPASPAPSPPAFTRSMLVDLDNDALLALLEIVNAEVAARLRRGPG